VGQQRLHKAIAEFGGQEKVQVEWKPFMIDPGTNVNGETVENYCRRRWGGAGWTNNLKSEGRKDGAKFANWKWWPHTLKAHQLVQYCADQEDNNITTDKVNESLFRAEYENGENISEVDALVRIGTELGVQHPNELSIYLTDDQGKIKVQKEIALGRQRYRISSVPFFIVRTDNSPSPYELSGAQKSETLLDLFQELSDH
jgi:predicted DsbA family dithiol-disulfide isomerase